MINDANAAYWGGFDAEELRAECGRRGLVKNGNKTQLIERLCESEERADTSLDASLIRLPYEEKAEAMRDFYSSKTIPALKALLREKFQQASLKGKKADLVDRLVYYELNAEDATTTTTNEDEEPLADPLQIPDMTRFMDIHGQSPLPPFTRQDITLYLAQYKKSIGQADEMYTDGFLRYVRFCKEGEHTFICGRVYAEMRKTVQYSVYCKLADDGEVIGCTCECTHGRGNGEAHCKHVSVVLLSVAQCFKEGVVTTEQTCTQQLQTFHHPRRKFRGTPLKARDLQQSRQQPLSAISENEDMSDEQYRTFFRNLLINSTFNRKMPLKTLLEPANPFAIFYDHDYSKFSTVRILLNHLRLINITTQEIADIAQATVQQSRDQQWHVFREPRLTASKFHEILHAQNPMKKAVTILSLMKFYSKATNHGIKFEPLAIEMYKKQNPGATVTQTGFVILESHPFIGATPDFLIDDDGVGEVKCPYTTRKYPVGPQYQPYLIWSKDGTRMKLKKKQYYYQVQGQMLVTGRQYCDFVVFTMVDIKTFRIKRKENFISLMLFELVDFYDKYYKEAILNKYLWRDYYKFSFKNGP